MATLPFPRNDWALFLDFDGTLVDLEDDPTQALVEPELRRAVAAARTFLGGALALVSGRPVSQMDKRFAPDHHAVAGIHGLERRSAQGVLRPRGRPIRCCRRLPSGSMQLRARTAHPHRRQDGRARDPLPPGSRCRRSDSSGCRIGGPATWRPAIASWPVPMSWSCFRPTRTREMPYANSWPNRRLPGGFRYSSGDDITDMDGFDAARSARRIRHCGWPPCCRGPLA